MLDPVIFRLGSFQLSWYALVYVLGFIVILMYLMKVSRKGEIELKEGEVYDLVLYLIIGMLVGARVFHIVFWGGSYYFENIVKIFMIWEGGLSFHGGFLGLVVGTWLFSKRRKVSFWKLADILVLPGVLFLAFGRLANYINQEIVGIVTNVRWCVNFEYNKGCRHPVQLYGAFGRFVLFVYLLVLKEMKRFKDGFIFWNFVFLIGVGRFLVDFLRHDAVYYGLRSGQWLSLLMIGISGWVLWKKYFGK